jgi:glutathione S-transferase
VNTVSRSLSDDTLNRVIQIESAGNPDARAGTSSAAGLGQFINATWLATVTKHKPALLRDNTRNAVAQMRVGRDTAALQVEMLARFTEDNAAALGRGYTDGDLYLAHFLGIGDARKLFRAPSSDLASWHVTAAAVKANRSILEGKTCAQVRAWAQASMEQRWVKAKKPDWVKKYASGSIPPRPPSTKKQTGTLAVIASVWAAISTFLTDHPFIIGGGVFLIVLAFVAWRVLKKD